MNVLLLYPEFPDTFWSFKHALKFIHKRASLPPFGLLTVAAMLPRNWAKRLVDVNVRKLRQKDRARADVVFVGLDTPEEASLAECDQRQNRGRDLVGDVKRIQRAGLEVQDGFIVGFDHYSPRPYYERIRTFLGEYQPPKISSHRLSGESPRAFVQASFRLGVLSRERFRYRGLLLWTFLRRPSQLSRAVTLLISGHHFRKICRVLRSRTAKSPLCISSKGVKNVTTVLPFTLFKTGESLAPILTGKFERVGLPDAGLSLTDGRANQSDECRIDAPNHVTCVSQLAELLEQTAADSAVSAIGYRDPQRVDEAMLEELRRISSFAPNQLPSAVAPTKNS